MARTQDIRTLSNGVKLTVAFDFLSLKLPNGATLTAGRSGEKAAGGVPSAVFSNFSDMVRKGQGNLDVRMTAWATETLPTVWPEYATVAPEPVIGMKISHDFGKHRSGPSGILVGTVEKLASRKGGRHNVRFPGVLMAMTSTEIAACPKV